MAYRARKGRVWKKGWKFSRKQPVARRRVNWFNSYNNTLCGGPDLFSGCKEESLEAPCCDNLGMLTLVNNSTLQQDYSDRARVVRMIGELWLSLDHAQGIEDLRALLALPNDGNGEAQAASLYLSYLNAYMRVGLWKTTIGKDSAGNDLFVGLNPMTSFSYTEGQWKHVWEHAWTQGRTDTLGQTSPGVFIPSGCCSVVTGHYEAPDILDGTTVPFTEDALDISTDCQPCAGTPPADRAVTGYGHNFHYPGAWHLRWDRKFSIPLRENEKLMLSIGWYSNPSTFFHVGPAGAITQPTLQVFGGIRTLLQF